MIVDHPLLKHKLTQLRNKETDSNTFRKLVGDITLLLSYETLRCLSLESAGNVYSPLSVFEGKRIKERIAIIPVLRAGQQMAKALLELLPDAAVHHIGIFREKLTLKPVEYYNKLPKHFNVDVCIVCDPVLATGGTSIATVAMLKEWGAKRIVFMVICASKAGLQALEKAHPDVSVFVGAMDDVLTKDGYIVPGLGDAGDRLFNTLK